jgi:hypothetical protein
MLRSDLFRFIPLDYKRRGPTKRLKDPGWKRVRVTHTWRSSRAAFLPFAIRIHPIWAIHVALRRGRYVPPQWENPTPSTGRLQFGTIKQVGKFLHHNIL